MPAQTFHTLLTEVSPSAESGSAAITIPAAGSTPAVHLDYNKLNDYVGAFAEALKSSGVQGGQVVSLSLVNSLEFVGAFLATGWLRAVSAPLNPAYSQDEIEFYLTDTKSSILIVKEGETSDDKPTLKAAKKCRVKVVSVKLSSGHGRKVEVGLKTVYDPSTSGATKVSLLSRALGRRRSDPYDSQQTSLVGLPIRTSSKVGLCRNRMSL
jgi:acyl-CoA synthetase (AMP-forming)/AMP-acid ligase II